MSAADRLDQIEARANAADRAGVFESDHPTWAAWEAAWDSSTDVPALVAALRAVLELHKPITEGVIVGDCATEECEHDGDCPEVPIDLCACCYDLAQDANPYYGERDVRWVCYPCPTVRVIEEALS